MQKKNVFVYLKITLKQSRRTKIAESDSYV